MSEHDPIEYKEQDEKAEYGSEYQGPHRRATDLPDKPGLHEKGSIRLQTINALVIAVASVSALVLLATIQKKQALIEQLLASDSENMELLRAMMQRQQWLTGVLLLVVVIEIVSVVALILWPMEEYIARIREHKMLPMRGSFELRYLAKAYNVMFEENLRRNEELRFKVEHDALTGLYNRGAYEKLLHAHLEQGGVALLWIDVDKFKGVNDVYGHDVGDKILQKVARLLAHGFRATDYACRTGGDEFAVIMTDITPGQQSAILNRIRAVQDGLLDTSDGLPETTLSIGVAFSAQQREGDDLFKMADKALYRVKEAGRNGCAFFTDEDR
ncbi:MAG: GGDEF domain-containing protein [Oscillospiraceae bacterium]|nr:GGDEF domain-containing protein [Oscillospiraceae bacterium]